MRERNPDPTAALQRWLAAEREAGEELAEAALLELCALLPPLAPSKGFADRVMRQIVAPPAAARPSLFPKLFRSRGFRLVLTCCLIATGISLLWLPQTLTALAGILSLGGVVQIGVASAVEVGQWLGMVNRIGEWLVTVVEAIAISLVSPAALKVTAACLATSGAAFVVLRDLMTRNRSWIYVDSTQ